MLLTFTPTVTTIAATPHKSSAIAGQPSATADTVATAFPPC